METRELSSPADSEPTLGSNLSLVGLPKWTPVPFEFERALLLLEAHPGSYVHALGIDSPWTGQTR